jgi:hypothetical protein
VDYVYNYSSGNGMGGSIMVDQTLTIFLVGVLTGVLVGAGLVMILALALGIGNYFDTKENYNAFDEIQR